LALPSSPYQRQEGRAQGVEGAIGFYKIMSLFDEDHSSDVIDPAKNYLEALVGEDKKFKTPEELARGKAESDAFIAKLIAEKKELEGKLNTSQRLEELIDRLGSKGEPPSTSDDTSRRELDEGKPPVDVRKLLDEALAERDQASIRKQNLDLVQAALQEKLGPGFGSILRQQAPSLGMTPEEMTSLAAEKPKAFLRLVGIDAPVKGTDLFTPPTSSQTSTFKPAADRDYAYWQKLRRENSGEYWKRQSEMHNDALRLGPKFYP
jgi:hypothetical protein